MLQRANDSIRQGEDSQRLIFKAAKTCASLFQWAAHLLDPESGCQKSKIKSVRWAKGKGQRAYHRVMPSWTKPKSVEATRFPAMPNATARGQT
jgi:hypothetical protein